MILLFGIIVVVIGLFLHERIRVDVIALMTMIALYLLGPLNIQEALSGFSGNAVVSISLTHRDNFSMLFTLISNFLSPHLKKQVLIT
jgi:di/tricarboxylate transporter